MNSCIALLVTWKYCEPLLGEDMKGFFTSTVHLLLMEYGVIPLAFLYWWLVDSSTHPSIKNKANWSANQSIVDFAS
jgi:hypothetical protein